MTEPLIQPSEIPPRSRTGRGAEELYTADQADLPAPNGDVPFDSQRESPPATPRWVKTFVIVAIALVVLLATVHLTGLAPTHGMPTHGLPVP